MLTIEEHIKYWLESADNDLAASEDNLKLGHYDWCLFIGHLVLEKALKALFVLKNNNKIPPKIHNLIRLAEQSDLILTKEQAKFFDDVTGFNIEGRYPEDKFRLYILATKEFTIENFVKIKETYIWLKSLIK